MATLVIGIGRRLSLAMVGVIFVLFQVGLTSTASVGCTVAGSQGTSALLTVAMASCTDPPAGDAAVLVAALNDVISACALPGDTVSPALSCLAAETVVGGLGGLITVGGGLSTAAREAASVGIRRVITSYTSGRVAGETVALLSGCVKVVALLSMRARTRRQTFTERHTCRHAGR